MALTAAATVTRTLLLGTGVALIAQRDPIITAKEVATLDQLSNGRFLFGVGIGWNREEIKSHGTDPKARGKLADELLETMQAIWTREIAEYHGDFVNLDPLHAWPKPVQRPHPPLYVGGGPAAFPHIARFGGGWYAVSPSSDELAASGMSAPKRTLEPVSDAPTTCPRFSDFSSKWRTRFSHLRGGS